MGKIKKIALINPKRPFNTQNPSTYEMYQRAGMKPWFAPPLNLFVIAAHTPPSIEIKIIDEHYETIDFNEHFDLVGITAMTNQANRAYEIADIYRKKNIYVAMGGIHATVLPAEAQQHVDSVFIGESELLWSNFIEDFEVSNPKSLYLSEHYMDLAKMKTPRYDLINIDAFKNLGNQYRMLPIQATRGCPHDCNFCIVSKFYGKKIRKRNINLIIEDIKTIAKLNLDLPYLFVDDNIFVNRTFAKELLMKMIPLKIKFIAITDIKIADDPELLDLAYRSGCFMLLIGFESLKPEALSDVNVNGWKMKQINNYSTAIEKIQSAGMSVIGAFVLGLKGDHLDDFAKTRDFVINNHILGQFCLLTPLPGSRIYEEFKAEGRLHNHNFWDSCNFYELNFKHDNFSKEEAENELAAMHQAIFSEENSLLRTHHMMQQYKKLPPRWTMPENSTKEA